MSGKPFHLGDSANAGKVRKRKEMRMEGKNEEIEEGRKESKKERKKERGMRASSMLGKGQRGIVLTSRMATLEARSWNSYRIGRHAQVKGK